MHDQINQLFTGISEMHYQMNTLATLTNHALKSNTVKIFRSIIPNNKHSTRRSGWVPVLCLSHFAFPSLSTYMKRALGHVCEHKMYSSCILPLTFQQKLTCMIRSQTYNTCRQEIHRISQLQKPRWHSYASCRWCLSILFLI